MRARRKGQPKDTGAFQVPGLRTHGQRGRPRRTEYPPLGWDRLRAGGAPVTGRGGNNEAGAFFMEGLVETAYDPLIMQWNYHGVHYIGSYVA